MGKLIWNSKTGVGYYPVERSEYDKEYFNKYFGYEDTKIGREINKFRTDIVNKYTEGNVLDIGIGSGAFIKTRGNCVGYDINPQGIKWLNGRGIFFNPYDKDMSQIDGLTFFDSLEHIQDPSILLDKVHNQHVVVSIPIFKNLEHILGSKHFRPTEHYHYFTESGLIKYMEENGFKCLETSDGETKIGREDIYTFIFKR